MTTQGLANSRQAFDIPDGPGAIDASDGDARVPIRRSGPMLANAFLRRCARVLPTDWRILLWSKETAATSVAMLDRVEIRHIPAGCLAVTCVKGDIALARGTALLRLVKYVTGHNQRATQLDAERPLLQQRKAPGLWQFAVRLPAVDDVGAAPVPHTRKVRVVAQEATTFAVVRRSGRPTEHAIDRAETVIMDTIARTGWFATGPAMCRIHLPGSMLPFVGSYEIAIPVVGQLEVVAFQQRAAINRPSNSPSRPVH